MHIGRTAQLVYEENRSFCYVGELKGLGLNVRAVNESLSYNTGDQLLLLEYIL